MTAPKTWFRFLYGGILAMILVMGCSSNSKDKWLNFFFDGVPSKKGAKPGDSSSRSFENTNLGPVLVMIPPKIEATSNVPQLVVHRPYEERRCTECHASNFSQRLKGDVSKVCTACHTEFLHKAKYSHAPNEDGQCTVCHEPHQSKEKKLLIKASQELCFDCHEPENVFKTKACVESGGRTCIECHDPHQEDKRFLIRSSPGKSSWGQKMMPNK